MSNVLHWTEDQLKAYREKFAQRNHEHAPAPVPDDKAPGPGHRPGHKPGHAAKRDPAPGAPQQPNPNPRACGSMLDYPPVTSVPVPLRGWTGKQTETERRYRECLNGAGRFEAVVLHLPGGGRYTPDFMTIDGGRVAFHEVKGSYRLGSQGRAYTAFHEAAAAFPMWTFVWAQWTGKEWSRKVFDSSVIVEG